MKAIILAAGEGSRLRPLSNTTPKPLISIFGKSILEHNLENIYKYVDEIIIVVKYKKELIIQEFGNDFMGTKISYKEQGEEKGTAAALRGISLQNEDILILNGDSIFLKDDLEKIISHSGYGALVKKVSDPSKYGIFSQDKNGFATQIIEKPSNFVGDLANVGVYKFSSKIIEISKNISLSPRGEYEITDSINDFLKLHPFSLFSLSGDFIDVGYPWDILQANAFFLDNLEESIIEGTIEENVVIKGKIILKSGAILKSGTYIEGNIFIGENTSIGPNAYLRGSSVIGKNCHIGNAVEVKNSSLGNKVNIAHLSYVGDSILGNNINLAGGTITSNFRHDGENIKVIVKGELVNTGLGKLGAIIGDNVKTGINTSIYPGRTLQNGTQTLPGEIIRK